MSLFPESGTGQSAIGSGQNPNAQCPLPADSTAKFRKLLPPVAPIRSFADLRTSEARPPAPAVPSPSGVLLPVELPCYLLRVICDQWDLYRFVVCDGGANVPVNSCSAKFARRMPGIVSFLRAQARRICPETGEVAWNEKRRLALLTVEFSPEDLYALLFFCCAGGGGSLDPVRDVIETVLSAWEVRRAFAAGANFPALLAADA